MADSVATRIKKKVIKKKMPEPETQRKFNRIMYEPPPHLRAQMRADREERRRRFREEEAQEKKKGGSRRKSSRNRRQRKSKRRSTRRMK